MEDLRKRLEAHERRGVEASLEMQMAARAILVENQRLRSLLALHGISQEEIDSYLTSSRLSDGGGSETLSGVGCITGETTRNRQPPASLPARNTSLHSQRHGSSVAEPSIVRRFPSSSATLASSPAAERCPSSDTSLHAPRPTSLPQITSRNLAATRPHGRQDEQDHQWPKDGQHHTADHSASSSTNMLPPVSDCFCPPEQSTSHANSLEAHETSCDAAAEILAELHSHRDTVEARRALGCTGTSNCSVKNTTIFQLMDELT